MRRWKLPNEIGIFGVLIVVFIVLSLLSPTFFTLSNTFTLLLNATEIAILSLGQTFVLLTAGIDLSVGAGIALSGVIAAIGMQHGLTMGLSVTLALLATTLVGVFNGVVIHYIKVPPFIVTFATMGVSSSIPLILTAAVPIPILNQSFAAIGEGFVGPVPVPVIILAVLAIVVYLILSKTVFGLHVYSVGGNRESARLAGVNTAKIDILVYSISGLMSGIAGLIDASRLMSGFPTAGSGNSLFFSISAAVVGGVSLFGGIGTIFGAIIGALLIGTLSDGMNILNVSSYWQSLVIGLIILLGVTFDTIRTSHRDKLSLRKVISAKFARKEASQSEG